MKIAKPILCLACLCPPWLMAQEAKVTPLLSKNLVDLPDKEGLMIVLDYPPGASDPVHRHNAHGFILCAGGLHCDAGQGRKRSDFDARPDVL